jgi:hypothetical protein
MNQKLYFVVLLTAAGSLFAEPEIYNSQCLDGFDNDFDGLKDDQEDSCRTANENAPFVDGPIVVGIGADRPTVTFDRPAVTGENDLTHGSLLIADLDGSGRKKMIF